MLYACFLVASLLSLPGLVFGSSQSDLLNESSDGKVVHVLSFDTEASAFGIREVCYDDFQEA